jgi:hypothetical protein
MSNVVADINRPMRMRSCKLVTALHPRIFLKIFVRILHLLLHWFSYKIAHLQQRLRIGTGGGLLWMR